MRKIYVIFFVFMLMMALSALTVVSAAPSATDTICAHSLAPRLIEGESGRVAQSFSSLRNAPAGIVLRRMPHHAEFLVLEGPVCAGFGAELAWYRLDYGDGVTGWASESQLYSPWGNNQYWLEPLPFGTGGPIVVPSPVPCAGSPAPRLAVGDTARVAQVFSSVRFSPAGSVRQRIFTGDEFTILEGPLCAGYGPLTWYRIDHDGLTGWVSEGQNVSIYGYNQYWVEPVPLPVP